MWESRGNLKLEGPYRPLRKTAAGWEPHRSPDLVIIDKYPQGIDLHPRNINISPGKSSPRTHGGSHVHATFYCVYSVLRHRIGGVVCVLSDPDLECNA